MSGFTRGDFERAVRRALAKRSGDSGPDADERFVLAVMASADAYRNAGCDEVVALAAGRHQEVYTYKDGSTIPIDPNAVKDTHRGKR